MQMNNDYSKRHHYYRNKVMFFQISFYVKFFYMQLQITENFTIDKNTSEQHIR